MIAESRFLLHNNECLSNLCLHSKILDAIVDIIGTRATLALHDCDRCRLELIKLRAARLQLVLPRHEPWLVRVEAAEKFLSRAQVY